jgi:ABC-type Fe3+-siderophore transport system permease subunit
MDLDYSRRERLALAALATVGFLGINGVFLWSLFRRPEALREALSNPVAAAFVVEAMILVGVLAWLFRKWGVTRLAWGWFVLLSLLGSLAFSIPVALLYRRRR